MYFFQAAALLSRLSYEADKRPHAGVVSAGKSIMMPTTNDIHTSYDKSVMISCTPSKVKLAKDVQLRQSPLSCFNP